LCCESDDDDSADKGKKHSNNSADENYAGAFSYFLEALVNDFGHVSFLTTD